ncbi:hypothetical protein AYR62_13420 [Secundilactobacillus paracollinoides]|nr:hypothetical protein AYR62_13420 [Secundilactobacillus paracollinoides]
MFWDGDFHEWGSFLWWVTAFFGVVELVLEFLGGSVGLAMWFAWGLTKRVLQGEGYYVRHFDPKSLSISLETKRVPQGRGLLCKQLWSKKSGPDFSDQSCLHSAL